MKKKFINSLKFGSLLCSVGNNIKADYTLALTYSTECEFGFKVKLEGDNNIILNNPTKCTNGDFDDILKKGNITEDKKNIFTPIELKIENFIPVYYKLKDSKDLILISDERNPDGSIDFNKPENVEEVYYILNNTATNKITFYSNKRLKNIIESKKFVIDNDYIYKVILNNFIGFKDLDNVKKHFDINIKSDDAKTYNIEILNYIFFKISDSVEFKICEKDIKDNKFIPAINNLDYVFTDAKNENDIFKPGKIELNDKIIKYTFEYNSKKYYIISDKKHKQNELFGFLKTKNNLKDKDLIFDPNSVIKIEEGTGNLVPEEYKIIEEKPKEDPKPQPQTSFKYNFTGDTNLSEHIGGDFVVDQKVKVQSLFKDQNTSKYVFVAIKEGTNERFINDQIIEPGNYELKREEKSNENNKNKEQGKESDQVDPEKSKKSCNCY